MSNALAIAAATATLRALLEEKLKPLPIEVTARPPDKAHENVNKDQVNLFLYQAAPSAAWRNMDMPRQLKPGETGPPPLPLTLSYLMTAYSDDDKDDVKSHQVLGRAMSIFHDTPLLDAAFIKDATASTVPGSDLHEQIERVRITLQPEPLDEIYKLWSAFQTHYRTSAAYKVDLVLIESTRPAKAPLPVLTRGKDDSGITSRPDVESPFPELLEVTPPNQQASALLGDVVTIAGHRLDPGAGTLEVRVSSPRLPDPSPVDIQPGATAAKIEIELKNVPAKWVAGLYTVSVVFTSGLDVRTTNELPLAVAPQITNVPQKVTRKLDESADIKLIFRPELRPGQRAVLLFDDREISTPLPTTSTDTLTFNVKKAPLGQHFVRLRIDGVDSLIVKRPQDKPPEFDLKQRVEIIP